MARSFSPSLHSCSYFVRASFFILLGALFSLGAPPSAFPSDQHGGTLVLSTLSDPKSFNSIIAKETSTTAVTGLIFEGLTTLDMETLQPKPLLAERWEVSEDGSAWTFYLRKDVRWNDGEPFTSDDVVFTFNDLVYNENIPSSARDMFTVGGKEFDVKALDRNTVRFILPQKFAPFLRAMSQAILPRHRLERSVREGTFNFTWGIDTPPDEIIGTGPFKLVQYRPGERLVFQRNPFYWKSSSDGERLPFINEVIMLIIQSPDTMLLKFLDGELDSVSVRESDFPLLKPLEASNNFTLYETGADFGSNFLVFNQNRGRHPETGKPYVEPAKLSWFTNLEFRRAVGHAVDKDKMIAILKNGLGYPQSGPMSPSAGFFYYPEAATYAYDLNKARRILAEAGFLDRDQDGVLEGPEGQRVEFNLFTNSNNPERIQVAAMIRHDLQLLGMRVNFLALEFNSLVSKLNATFDWDAIILGLTGGIEPHFGKNVWSSGGQLHMWYPRQEKPATAWEERIDEIFDQAVQEFDPAKRKALYDEWQEIVSEKLPFIYTILGKSLYVVRNRFGNLKPSSYGGVFHNIEEIFIKEEFR